MLSLRKLLYYKKSNVQIRRYFSKLFNSVGASKLAAYKMKIPKTRDNPIIMQLNTPEFKSVFTEELATLSELFKKYGFEIRIAGGAVRDLLMGQKPKDLDFATTATPVEMKSMFEKENVRMINMNGEKHGTITPRINDKENFEVTTLRIDVVTDGRHAEVQFTTDWLLDALRRDLTINSMYLDLEGSVYDYFFGYEDLKERRVAFVGDAVTRIQEDYLRILRYFRFYGKISSQRNNHEEETLKAICENASGLERISGERIWTELKKILEGNFAGDLIEKIVECGLSPYIGLPKNPNVDELKRVWGQCENLHLHSITLLSTLLNSPNDAIELNARLKLSAFERDLALFITEHRTPILYSKPLLPYQQMIVKSKLKTSVIKDYVVEVLKYTNSPYLQELESWEVPKFPVNGTLLKQKGIEGGRLMGFILQELKNRWADREFQLTADDLLKLVPEIVECAAQKKKNKPNK